MPMYKLYEDKKLLFRHWREESPTRADFHMHIHDEYEILYFVEGTAGCIVETNAYPLIPGSLVIMRPSESHMIDIHDSEPYERYTLNFSPTLLDPIDRDHKLLRPFLDRALGDRNLFSASEFTVSPRRLFESMATAVGGDELVPILSNFYALLTQINLAFEKKKPAAAFLPRSLATDIASYINRHLFEELSVTDLAEKFYVSVSQLNRRFKAVTGFSVWEYIREKRLSAARDLIRTGCPATRAYVKCGFNDYSSFYRGYVNKFGVSPAAEAPRGKKLL